MEYGPSGNVTIPRNCRDDTDAELFGSTSATGASDCPEISILSK